MVRALLHLGIAAAAALCFAGVAWLGALIGRLIGPRPSVAAGPERRDRRHGEEAIAGGGVGCATGFAIVVVSSFVVLPGWGALYGLVASFSTGLALGWRSNRAAPPNRS